MLEAKKIVLTKKIYDLGSLSFLKGNYYNIGLLGGSFDPAHAGHIHISEQALEKLGFDYVIWLVALQNDLKPIYQSNIFERAQNALNIIYNPQIIVSTLENDLKQNITYEVVKFLYENFSKVKFTWIMGSDNLKNFDLWDNFMDIPKFCKIDIFNRPGSIINEHDFQNFKTKFITSDIDKNQSNNIIFCEGPMIDVSSSSIKAQQMGR